MSMFKSLRNAGLPNRPVLEVIEVAGPNRLVSLIWRYEVDTLNVLIRGHRTDKGALENEIVRVYRDVSFRHLWEGEKAYYQRLTDFLKVQEVLL